MLSTVFWFFISLLIVCRVMSVTLRFNVYAPIFMLSVSREFMIFRIFLVLSVGFFNFVPAARSFHLPVMQQQKTRAYKSIK